MIGVLRLRMPDGSVQSIPAIKGDNGEPGADGYTPIKGVDYWREEDKQEIVEEISKSLPISVTWENKALEFYKDDSLIYFDKQDDLYVSKNTILGLIVGETYNFVMEWWDDGTATDEYAAFTGTATADEDGNPCLIFTNQPCFSKLEIHDKTASSILNNGDKLEYAEIVLTPKFSGYIHYMSIRGLVNKPIVTQLPGFYISNETKKSITRKVVGTYSDLNKLIGSDDVYEGIMIYVAEDKKSYQLIDNKWEPLSGEQLIFNGDGVYSLVSGENSQAISDYSIAFGWENIAGCKGFYIKSIDMENKKIYLSLNQVYDAMVSTDDNTDESFETPNYKKDDEISIIALTEKGETHSHFCAKIVDIKNNVITYDGELLFTSIYSEDGIFPIFTVPSKPEIGVVVVGSGGFSGGFSTISAGDYSHAEGIGTISAGDYGHAEGNNTKAGYCSHAEGYNTRALWNFSHAEGRDTLALGTASHSEGANTQALSGSNHAEGYYTTAIGSFSHAEGRHGITHDEAEASHVEGRATETFGAYAHAEGHTTKAYGQASHTEGVLSEAEGKGAHAEGLGTKANGDYAHSEGVYTKSLAEGSHAEGSYTEASGNYSHAEGGGTNKAGTSEENIIIYVKASGESSHAEGRYTEASGMGSHAEGFGTLASPIISSGQGSHAEGVSSKATANASHAEGYNTTASGQNSHAEGNGSTASNTAGHAEGHVTTASGKLGAHSEGRNTQAIGDTSHAEGYLSQAKGKYSHSEGHNSLASGEASHSQGFNTQATGIYSHAEGDNTIAKGKRSHVQGRYNIIDDNNVYAHIVGNGKSDTERSNAHTVDWSGNAWFAGEVFIGHNNEKLLTETSVRSIIETMKQDIINDVLASIPNGDEVSY